MELSVSEEEMPLITFDEANQTIIVSWYGEIITKEPYTAIDEYGHITFYKGFPFERDN